MQKQIDDLRVRVTRLERRERIRWLRQVIDQSERGRDFSLPGNPDESALRAELAKLEAAEGVGPQKGH